MLIREYANSSWKRIGYEANFEINAPSWNAAEAMVPAAASLMMLREIFAGKELVDATAMILHERTRKTGYEIERLDIASEISCFGLDAFEQAVEVGISGVELAAIVEKEIMIQGTGYRGSVRVRAFAQVSTGATETVIGHRPNIISTARKMADGDFALLELGLVVDGYWGDRTRARVAGTPRDEQLKIYETCTHGTGGRYLLTAPRCACEGCGCRGPISDRRGRLRQVFPAYHWSWSGLRLPRALADTRPHLRGCAR